MCFFFFFFFFFFRKIAGEGEMGFVPQTLDTIKNTIIIELSLESIYVFLNILKKLLYSFDSNNI